MAFIWNRHERKLTQKVNSTDTLQTGEGFTVTDVVSNRPAPLNGKPKYQQMTEEEFAQELKQSLLILSTSSPDKRDIYRQLFSSHAKTTDHHAGLDLFFADIGSFRIATRKTKEQTNEYIGNLLEKAYQQMDLLRDPPTSLGIRSQLMLGKDNEFDPEEIKLMGMTEDSGYALDFQDKETEKKFMSIIKAEVAKMIRPQDQWLIKELETSGFPGVNLKPLQEHLEGGFNTLMDLIYDTAEKVGMNELRFTGHVSVSFVSPDIGKYFTKSFEHHGRLLSRTEYRERLLHLKAGEAINSNFVQVLDGQRVHAQPLDVLIKEGLYTKSKDELPAHYARRELTEYLQGLIGKRRSSKHERNRDVKVGYVSPSKMHGNDTRRDTGLPAINDLKITKVPTYSALRRHPNMKMFGDADVVVLQPDDVKKASNDLRADPNYALLLSFVVSAVTDPESMSIPIVVDNRSGKFDSALELISDAFHSGRLMGETPFLIANTFDELSNHLEQIKDIKQRAPVIKTPQRNEETEAVKDLPEPIPRDDVFTLFIGGGHNNNSARDMEDAKALGYYCAEQGWRIVTGAGVAEGSMGSLHTGFIQYHLDRFQKMEGYQNLKDQIEGYMGANGKYDAEGMISSDPQLIDMLANKGFIPRNMFYGYSMKSMLEMESPTGEPPAGITYFESGNRMRRLPSLLAPGTKVFLPGSVGTDEEFEETVRQHLEAMTRKKVDGIANDIAFADGTPDDQGMIIIYNRSGHLTKLLEHYNLSDNLIGRQNREKYNVVVINADKSMNQEEAQSRLIAAVTGREHIAKQNWLGRIREQGAQRTKQGVV